ncbi:hypothetical protein [Lutimonas sp.]|uniref:hypothetical protein n=1 Tax=Lutimonas sp. TaxID=1872403 RepID=UPI003D9ABAE6
MLLFSIGTYAQVHSGDLHKNQHELSPLFKEDSILKVKFNYSKKDVLAYTNDSTYIQTELNYSNESGSITSIKINIRARGNYRRLHCYYLPLWVKIDKKHSKGTIFEQDRKLKMVLPCLKSTRSNDHVIKELLAYKIYELISPYHFETKMLAIELHEERGKKSLDHDLIGFLIQDDKKLAAASGGKIVKRRIHPNAQDPISSTRNDMFQYMIGNTDYSLAYQHNEKLFYLDKKFVPVPYDFDMSGLVNVSYAVVSEIKNKTLPISNVTTRLYRGFQQKESVIQQVRQEYIKKEEDIFQTIDTYESYFKDPKEFKEARDYLEGFFKIIKDDKKFQSRIIDKARTKLD